MVNREIGLKRMFLLSDIVNFISIKSYTQCPCLYFELFWSIFSQIWTQYGLVKLQIRTLLGIFGILLYILFDELIKFLNHNSACLLRNLTLSYIILKSRQIYFENLVVFTPQDF